MTLVLLLLVLGGVVHERGCVLLLLLLLVVLLLLLLLWSLLLHHWRCVKQCSAWLQEVSMGAVAWRDQGIQHCHHCSQFSISILARRLLPLHEAWCGC